MHSSTRSLLAIGASLVALILVSAPASAETGLVMSCANPTTGPLSVASTCTDRLYVRPKDTTVVASRPNGATCEWSGTDCQWRLFGALAANDDVLTCAQDIPLNASIDSTDPCGIGGPQKPFVDKSTVTTLADADVTLTFIAQTVTGAGSVTPVLTWSTSPAAQSCTASGAADWTGAKPASGEATLAAITQSRTYTMSCTWAGDTVARLTWTAPTRNTDETTLAKCASQTTVGPCLRSFSVHRGVSAQALSDTVTVDDRNATGYTWSGLPQGTHFFAVKARTGQGVESAISNVVSKVIGTGSTVNRTVGITVNPEPEAITDLAVE